VSPIGTEEQQIVAQYVKFWTKALPAAFAATAPRRKSILAPTTANPQLDLLLNNMAALDASGERGYGTDVPLDQSVRRDAGSAIVRGCLDSTKSGIADDRTGELVTRGVRQNPVQVSMSKNFDGIWRISAVIYTGGRSC
jgi:hypothetical protein